MRPTLSTSLMVLALIWAGTALAKPPAGPPPGGPEPGSENYAELMEKIATVRLWKLVDALDLDDETALKLNRYLRSQDEQRAEVMREHHDLHRRVKAFIDADTDDDAQAAALIEEGIAIEQRSQELELETVRGLDDVLSPSQQLRFILANREFEREIAEIVRQHRGGKRGGHGPPPGGP